MKLPLVTFSLPLLFVLLSNPSASAAARFYELGPIEGVSYNEPTDISSNGRIVVGYAEGSDGMGHPFRQVRLGPVELFPVSTSYSGIRVSADGSVALAHAGTPAGDNRAFLWNRKTGITYIETDPGFLMTATDISGNGKVVCGYLHDSGSSTAQPIRWSAKTGVQALASSTVLGGDPSAVNYTGDIIVGGIWSRPSGHQACRWVRDETYELLPDHGIYSYGNAVNFRGDIIAGYSRGSDNIYHAVRWVAGSGMQMLDATTPSYAVGISADGNRIVGNLIKGDHLFDQGAFIWTPRLGLRNMNDVFHKTLPHGWRFLTVTGISGDGRWVVGGAETLRGEYRGFILDTGFERSQ